MRRPFAAFALRGGLEQGRGQRSRRAKERRIAGKQRQRRLTGGVDRDPGDDASSARVTKVRRRILAIAGVSFEGAATSSTDAVVSYVGRSASLTSCIARAPREGH